MLAPSWCPVSGSVPRRGWARPSTGAVQLLLVGGWQLFQPATQRLTQDDINEAVNFAMDERPRPPSVASMAYAAVYFS